jgi:hypothetical protein
VNLLIIPTLPLFIDQIHSLLNNFPDYMNKTAKLLNLKVSDNQFQTFLTSQLNSIGENIVAVTGQIFGAFFAILTLFVISFYMLIDHERIKRNITELLIKRIESENSVLESYLRKRLINDNFAQKLISENQTNYSFEKELRYLRSLGGLRLFSNGKLFFSYGDWTDLFLDSFSGQKLKSSELLRSFKYKEETEVVFFVLILENLVAYHHK